MLIIETLLMGMVMGLAAFFPISSSGAVLLLGQLFRLEVDVRLYSALLIGVIAAIIVAFRRDLLRLLRAFLAIVIDLIINMKTFFVDRNRRGAYGYRRVLTGNYRNLLLMLAIAMVPTVLIGFVLHPLTRYATGPLLMTAMGFLITALILLVSSYIHVPERGPKSMKLSDALFIGIFQGFTFIPGISRIAAVTSCGFLCGMSRRLIIKMSCLMSMLCMLVLLFPGSLRPALDGAASGVPVCVIGGVASFAVATIMLRMAMQAVNRRKNRMFAAYNAIVAGIAVLVYMIRR